MMHILLPDASTVTRGDLDFSGLQKLGALHVFDRTTPEQLAQRLQGMDAVLCNKTVFSKDILNGAPNLRYIGLFATGYNNIDIGVAKAQGITVCNAGQYSTAAVTQHVFALLLAHMSQVAQYDHFVQKGGWMDSPTFSPFVYPAAELAGKTMGIVGFGSIGQAVAKVANAFGMRVLVCTRTPKADENVSFVTLDTLLRQSDVISFHCPLTDKTRGMVGKKELQLCKKTAFLINTARGGIVEEAALADALKKGDLAGAGVNVLEQEPMRRECPLAGAPHLILTPHIAWAPLETRRRLLCVVEDNLRSYLEGTPKNVVNR